MKHVQWNQVFLGDALTFTYKTQTESNEHSEKLSRKLVARQKIASLFR